MDNHGRTGANHTVVTAHSQRAAPKAIVATWLLATILTMALGQHVLAKDTGTSGPVLRTPEAFPGIRQPDYATPIGGVAVEPELDIAPADPGQKLQNKATSETDGKKATQAGKKTTTAAKPDSTWSSLWQQVFASDATPLREELPRAKADITSDGPAERLAGVSSNSAGELLQKVSPSHYFRAFNEEVVRPSGNMEEMPPAADRSSSLKLTKPVAAMGDRGAALSGLGQQLALRNDEPLPEKSAYDTVNMLRRGAADGRKTLDDSALLQPFKLTNPAAAPSQSYSNRAPSATPNQSSQSVFGASPFSMLTGQLTMSATDNYRSLADSLADSPMLSEQMDAERGMTVSLPSIANPFTLSHDPRGTAETAGRTQLVAYQESLPAPPAQEGDDVFRDDTTQNNSGSEQGGDREAKTLADAEKVGEEPQDNSLQFLRTQTVLLEPGESQCDIGINYLFAENAFPVLILDAGDPVGVDDALFRIRELTIPIEYRVGLLKRVQGFIGAPIGWSNTQVSLGDFEQFQNDGGFGDLDLGATIQVIEGNAECPHGLFTIVATAPTGGDPFGTTAILAPSAPSLGQGFWSVSANALCIQTYDPLVFFYGVGAEHFFSREFNEREIEPGNSWNYSFGVGFAVNERVTLSTRFLGSYIEELRVNRERVLGTNVEPMSIRMAATISKPCNRLVEPFVEFGITDAAVSSFFGITWTY